MRGTADSANSGRISIARVKAQSNKFSFKSTSCDAAEFVRLEYYGGDAVAGVGQKYKIAQTRRGVRIGGEGCIGHTYNLQNFHVEVRKAKGQWMLASELSVSNA